MAELTEEEYGTEVSIEELKGHYETNFMTSSQFIDLVKEWHKEQLKKDFKPQLIEISEGKGSYSLDKMEHASNCIRDMKILALELLKKIEK